MINPAQSTIANPAMVVGFNIPSSPGNPTAVYSTAYPSKAASSKACDRFAVNHRDAKNHALPNTAAFSSTHQASCSSAL
jgi:hypothetical protein